MTVKPILVFRIHDGHYQDLIFPGNTITHFAGSKILLVFFYELHLFFTFNTVCFYELHLFLRLMCAFYELHLFLRLIQCAFMSYTYFYV